MSYEKIVHDTLLDNYGVFAFNGSKTGNAYADFLLGLPSTMTQDAPIRKTDNGWYVSLFAQDDLRIHKNVTLNLGLRYDLQFPYTDPQDRKLAYVPGQKSQVSPTSPEGLLFPGDPGIRARDRQDRLQQHRAAASASRGTPRATAGCRCAPPSGCSTAAPPATSGTRRADNQPFTVRQPFPHGLHALGSLPQPAGRHRPVPVLLRPGQPPLHAARRRSSARRSTSSGRTPTR